MKIVHIVRDNFTPDSLNGVYKVIDSISNALTTLEVDVEVCSVSSKLESKIYVPKNYKHVRVKEHKLRFFMTDDLKRYLLSHSKDTIFHFHSVFIPWFLPSISLLKKNGYQVVLTPHGQYVEEAMKKSFKKRVFFHFFDRKIIRIVDRIQCIGHTEVNKYIIKNTNNYVINPNGCSCSFQNVNVNKRLLIFGYMGRLQLDQKGLDLMISAFFDYKKNGGKGILKIAGDGKDKAIMKQIISKLDLKDCVCFEGILFGDDKWKFLNNCAFFLHPSRWDVVPTAAMEAAACHVPLIVTKATNLDNYVEQFQAGFVIENVDVRRYLAEAMFEAEKLFSEKETYKNICKNSAMMIDKELNWNIIAKKNIDILYS